MDERLVTFVLCLLAGFVTVMIVATHYGALVGAAAGILAFFVAAGHFTERVR